MARKLGHIAERAVIIEATIALGKSGLSNTMSMRVVWGKNHEGDERDELFGGARQVETFQMWQQGFIDGAKLQNREHFRG